MSYEVQFRGRDLPSITIDNEKGEKLWDLWFAGDQKNTPVDAGNSQAFLVGDIKRIAKVPDPKLEIPDFTQGSLPQGKKCAGTYSIQREINNIIKNDYPQTWAKEIANKQRREEIRKKLHDQAGVMWCDAKVGECAC